MVALHMTIVEDKLLNCDSDTSFSLKCYNVLGSIHSNSCRKEWSRALNMHTAFVGDKEGAEGVTMLTKKEMISFWGDLPSYLQSLKDAAAEMRRSEQSEAFWDAIENGKIPDETRSLGGQDLQERLKDLEDVDEEEHHIDRAQSDGNPLRRSGRRALLLSKE